MDIIDIGYRIAIFFVPFLFSLCFHEFAHGFVAKLRGDNTAEMMGRLTLNPMAHADPIGTFILPLSAIVFQIPIFFGWAKPVPVNNRNLKNPRIDMFWIALAGPLSNIFLSLIGAILLGFLVKFLGMGSTAKAVVQIFDMFISINLFLAIFNIIPLNPLDGGKVIARFLPRELNYKLEQNEHITSWILLFLVMTGVLRFLAIPVTIMHGWLMHLAQIIAG